MSGPISAADAGLVRFIFPGRAGRTGEVILRWEQGKMIRDYYHDPVLRPYGLMAARKYCRLTNQNHQKLRTSHVPKSGDTIIMQRVGRAMS